MHENFEFKILRRNKHVGCMHFIIILFTCLKSNLGPKNTPSTLLLRQNLQSTKTPWKENILKPNIFGRKRSSPRDSMYVRLKPPQGSKKTKLMGSLFRSRDYRGQRMWESIGPNPFVTRDKANINFFVYGYAKFSTLFRIDKWWSVNPPSQVKKKINFF